MFRAYSNRRVRFNDIRVISGGMNGIPILEPVIG